MNELPRRRPQTHMDRNLSWSGQITPPPRPCTDLDLMTRLLAALHNLAESEEDSE